MLFIQRDDTQALLDLGPQFLGRQTRVKIDIADRASQVLLEDDGDDSVELDTIPVESTPA